MIETVRIEDMRVFAAVAEAKSFTRAARVLGLPKQTVSRRVGTLERALGVQLLFRTTRSVRLSDVGAAYAARCTELARMADEANRAARDADDVPRGMLRITADPVLGEAFLSDLVVDYARTWSEVRLDVVLTRRRVDLVEEGFDVAFRVGSVDDAALACVDLGPARVRYCASPDYVARRGAPSLADDLKRHACLVVGAGAEPVRWPLPGRGAPRLVAVSPRCTFTSLAMARAAAIAGLGVALFPEFTCADDLRAGRLVGVLGDAVDVGSVWLVHRARAFLPARVRAFVELARERFAASPPWLGPRDGGARGARPRASSTPFRRR